MQADMVLEKEVRFYILILRKHKGAMYHCGHSLIIRDLRDYPHSDILSISIKVTPPNSLTPYGPSIQTYESMGAIPTYSNHHKSFLLSVSENPGIV